MYWDGVGYYWEPMKLKDDSGGLVKILFDGDGIIITGIVNKLSKSRIKC